MTTPFRARLIAAVAPVALIAIIANALLSWRTLAVLENDVAHITAELAEIKTDLRELRQAVLRPPAYRR